MRHVLFMFALAVATIVGWGIAFSCVEHIGMATSLYWALTTATTVGYGDITPNSAAGHALAAGAMITSIPLLASCFGLLTSWHVRKHTVRHVEDQFAKHHEANELTQSGIRNILLLLHKEDDDGPGRP